MIITNESHTDHALTTEQIEYIKTRFADRTAFFIETFELPEHLGTVEVSLVGPATGGAPVPESAVEYHIRNHRKWASRRIYTPEKPQSRLVTVIAGPHTTCPSGGKCTGAVCADYADHVEHACVLYTAYGGMAAPREPGDPSIASWEELVTSREFWSQHALIW